MLLGCSLYLFHPHTALLCSREAMNGSAVGVSHWAGLCSPKRSLTCKVTSAGWSADSADKGTETQVTHQAHLKNSKKQLKYFLNVHVSLISLAFHALICSTFSPSSLCFPIALWNSSAWTCIQRKNTAQCNSLLLSIIHFALVIAIISSENRNGGKTEPQFEYNQFVFAAVWMSALSGVHVGVKCGYFLHASGLFCLFLLLGIRGWIWFCFFLKFLCVYYFGFSFLKILKPLRSKKYIHKNCASVL